MGTNISCKKGFFFTSFLFFCVNFSFAVDITWDGSSSTNWATGTNWSGDAVPTSSDNVTIADVANDPTISAATSAYALNLTIDNGAILTNATTTGILDIYGSFTNNGTFNHSGTAYTYLNGVGKTLGGTGVFTTTGIYLWSGSTTTLSSNVTIGDLKIYNSAATSFSLSSYYYTATVYFEQQGTLNFNSGTLEARCVITNPNSARWNSGTGLFYENIAFSGTWATGYTFYDLKVSCSGYTYSFAGTTTITRDLTVVAGTVDVVASTLNLGRDLTNTGTFTASTSGLVNLNGGAAQTISGAGSTTFHDLTIANTSGDVALSSSATVTGTLTMSSGDLVIATTKTLTITDVDDPGISGGSASTMIVTSGSASVVKNYSSTTAITFPFGNGTRYRPITITPSAVTASNWTASYTPSAYSDLTLNGIARVSVNEYWTLNQSVNLNSTIQLTWISTTGVTDYTLLKVAKYDGADWVGIASSPSGDNTSGNLPTTAATTVGTTTSYWALGSSSAVNTLPIELISFKADKTAFENELKWTTATELNNDFFTVEKTYDGTNFEFIGQLKGAGNSTQFSNYILTDYNVRPVINYYRLKQTDYDGQFTFSEVIAVDNTLNSSTKEVVMKTNVLG